MPTFIHLSNLVVLKSAVEKKYKGGLDQFRKDYQIGEDIYYQEDEHLFSIASMNADEHDTQDLKTKGLHFDFDLRRSDDFTIITRYGGCYWVTNWVVSNDLFVWHPLSSTESIAKAQKLGNATMGELSDIFDRGENPFSAIW